MVKLCTVQHTVHICQDTLRADAADEAGTQGVVSKPPAPKGKAQAKRATAAPPWRARWDAIKSRRFGRLSASSGFCGAPQSPPKIGPHTNAFVASLCDGLGAIFDAVEFFTAKVGGLACERETNLRDLVRRRWPNLSHFGEVARLDMTTLAQRIGASGCSLVLLGAGPPCQPFSGLSSSPKGFEDERTAPLKAFVRIRDDLEAYCRGKGLVFKWLLEEVASMSITHRQEITQLVGSQPVLIHAADFGWVHRPRLYWGLQSSALDHAAALELPGVEIFPPGKLAEGIHVAKWSGSAWPKTWTPDDGFEWRYRDEVGKRGMGTPGAKYAPTYAQGRFLTFTTAFRHPADRPPPAGKGDQFVFQRFVDDDRLRPLASYVRGNVLWKGSQARPLNPDECEVLIGLPRGATADFEPKKGQTPKQTRLHAIGNSFHVPSIVMFLMLLFGVAPTCVDSAKVKFPATEQTAILEGGYDMDMLAQWDVSSESELARYESAAEAFDEAITLLPGVSEAHPQIVKEARAELQGISVVSLMKYEEYLQASGAPLTARGPDVQALMAKSSKAWAMGKQHRPSAAHGETTPMVMPGCGPVEHVRLAKGLDHPFAQPPVLELDLQFVVETYAHLGPLVRRARATRLSVLRDMALATQNLDDAIRSRRHVSIPGMLGVRPVFTALMVVLLGWPDRKLPRCVAHGFTIAGDIEPSGVLKPIDAKCSGAAQPIRGERLLGPDAEAFVEDLVTKTKVTDTTVEAYKKTVQEIQDGLADPFQTKEQMDACYGPGGYRPLPRHVILQKDEWRPIDDGKRARVNPLSKITETVVHIPPILPLLAIKGIAARIGQDRSCLPGWFNFEAAVEDWHKGYRQLFPTRRQMRFNHVAVLDPNSRQWLFSRLRGLPFGLGSAVNQFTRYAMLMTAVARRLLFTICGHYVDDNIIVEMACLAGDGHEGFRMLAQMLGVNLSDKKRQLPASVAAFLGQLFDLSLLNVDYAVTCAPKLGARESLTATIQDALCRGKMTSGEAAHIRGVAQWLDSVIAGRPCRGAMTALIARQHYEAEVGITPNLEMSLRYLLAAIEHLPDAVFELFARSGPPVVVYTDASAEGHRVRIGGIVYARGARPSVFVYDVSAHLRPLLGEGETVINQAELLAAPLLLHSAPGLLRGKDILWFIDNTSAEAALVKSGSPTQSMCHLALVASAALAGLGARPWYDHVASDDNPADVLSRAGYDDPRVQSMVESGQWQRIAVVEPSIDHLHFDALWRSVL